MTNNVKWVSNRFFIIAFAVGMAFSFIVNGGSDVSPWRFWGLNVFMGFVAALGSNSVVCEIGEKVGNMDVALSVFNRAIIGVGIFLALATIPRSRMPPKPCHPKCHWCQEAIENWEYHAREDAIRYGGRP